jgi:hypothetical protein
VAEPSLAQGAAQVKVEPWRHRPRTIGIQYSPDFRPRGGVSVARRVVACSSAAVEVGACTARMKAARSSEIGQSVRLPRQQPDSQCELSSRQPNQKRHCVCIQRTHATAPDQ